MRVVLLAVSVIMVMMMRSGREGDELHSAMLDAARGEEPIAGVPQLVGEAAHHDDLEAVVVIEVDVQRRAHALTERMLEVREPLGEISNVMVVDQRERRDGVGPRAHASTRDLGAHEIAKELRPRPATLFDERIELFEERAFHGHAKPHQGIFHRAISYQLSSSS